MNDDSLIVRRIEFDEAGNPTRITVDMTIDHAGDIASVFGGLKPGVGGCTPRTTNLYLELTGQVFNRLWEAGIDGWRRGARE